MQTLTLGLAEGRSDARALGVAKGIGRDIVRERLPFTLVLVGLSNLVLFFATISAALVLSRKHGGLLDRLNVLLLSLTSAPSWIHGLVLIQISAAYLHILPFPRRWDALPDRLSLDYAMLMLRHMILPAAAILVSGFFQGVYAWRAFFLIFRHEDYVEIARAKGLRPWAIEQSHILRPTLPYILTNFATMMIVIWQGTIALEMVFMWPGVGPLFMQAARNFDTPLLLGVVVICAYLLALTVSLLDIVCALVDPRVRVGSPDRQDRLRSARTARRGRVQPWVWLAGVAGRLSAARAWFAALAGQWVAAVCALRLRRRPAPEVPTPPTAARPRTAGGTLGGLGSWRKARLWPAVAPVLRSPSSLLGPAVILGMVVTSIYVVIALPRDQVVALWWGQGGNATRAAWYRNPKSAPPAWTNLFRADKLPTTIAVSTRPGEVPLRTRHLPWITGLDGGSSIGGGASSKVLSPVSDDVREVTLSLLPDYPYHTFPQDVAIYLDVGYTTKKPYARLTWVTPGEGEIDLGAVLISSRSNMLYLSQDRRLQRAYGEQTAIQGLFADPASERPAAQRGRYDLRIDGMVFEEASDMDVEVVVHGRVAGLAGTDSQRRDLAVGLGWGMPVALSFGLLGTLGTSLLSMTLAGVSVWFGGWVDELIQRLTDLNMILPTLPIVILVFFLYSKSILAILGVVVLLGIFGSGIKNYRSAFLKMRAAPYIEAGRACGAGGWRIIGRYLIPRILPVMVPQMAILVPSYVFLEATLAYLGVSDQALPTWGKVIKDALTSGDLVGRAYWALEPVGLLPLTGLAFAGLGFALERILNPRLAEE